MPIHIRLTVDDRHGVLDRITGLIRRNGLNISEINAGAKGDGTSHISIRTKDKGADIDVLRKGLAQLECVRTLEECTGETHYSREVLLFSVRRSDCREGMFPGAQLMEQAGSLMILAYMASPDDIDALLADHKDLICDYSRGGALAIKKEGVEDK